MGMGGLIHGVEMSREEGCDAWWGKGLTPVCLCPHSLEAGGGGPGRPEVEPASLPRPPSTGPEWYPQRGLPALRGSVIHWDEMKRGAAAMMLSQVDPRGSPHRPQGLQVGRGRQAPWGWRAGAPYGGAASPPPPHVWGWGGSDACVEEG